MTTHTHTMYMYGVPLFGMSLSRVVLKGASLSYWSPNSSLVAQPPTVDLLSSY